MADSVEQAVYDYLTTDSTFMASFSGVYWIEATKAQAVSPYIVFWRVDDIGESERLNIDQQGEARIQFDLWDTNKNRGRRLNTVLRKKVKALNETLGGYRVFTTGVTEQTIQRASNTDPFHYVVDGIIKWNEE